MDTKPHTHPCRPQTDIWSVCACVFEEGGCQPTETRGMVPVQNTHNQDQNLVPKEGIGSAGRFPRQQVKGSAAQAEGTGAEDALRGHTGQQPQGHQDTQTHRGGHRLGTQWVIWLETFRASGEGAHPGRGGDTQSCGPTSIRVWVGLEREAALYYAHYPDATPPSHNSRQHLGTALPPRPTGFHQWELK